MNGLEWARNPGFRSRFATFPISSPEAVKMGEIRNRGRLNAGARQRLLKAQQRLTTLQAGVRAFFDSKPFLMSASTDSQKGELDLYRFRMIRKLPTNQQWIARRLLLDLRKLTVVLDNELPSTSTLRRLARIGPGFGLTVLTPGVHAEATLVMDGAEHLDCAIVHAPRWDARSKEVTVTRHDPHGQFRGAIDVLYHLEFRHAADLSGRSALDLFATALQEAELAIRD